MATKLINELFMVLNVFQISLIISYPQEILLKYVLHSVHLSVC